MDKDLKPSKVIKVLKKPIEQDLVATGNDSHLYRSVEKALGADVKELAEKYSVTISQKILGEVSEEFVREVERKALDLGRAYGIRRILSKRKLIMDIAFDRAQNDPKGQSILLKLMDILINGMDRGKTTKKVVEERKVKYEDIVNKPNTYSKPDGSGEDNGENSVSA